jgi:hypothetical protein
VIVLDYPDFVGRSCLGRYLFPLGSLSSWRKKRKRKRERKRKKREKTSKVTTAFQHSVFFGIAFFSA